MRTTIIVRWIGVTAILAHHRLAPMRHPQLPILEPIPKGLLLALFSVAGHANSLDDLGLSFVVVSLVILACTLVAQPLLAHRFADPDAD